MAAIILKKVNQWLQLISGNSFLLYFLESKENINYSYFQMLRAQSYKYVITLH